MSQRRLFAVVLAAGASARFGSTKQLAPLRGAPLVAGAARKAEAVCGRDSLLVTGNEWQAVAGAAAPLTGFFVVNPRYAEGMSTSICCGVRAISGVADGILIMLADQPLITVDHLRSMVETWYEQPEAIIATSWQDAGGPPVIFPRYAFGDLMSLSGDAGARRLIENADGPVVNIRFEAGGVDVDRPSDLTLLEKDPP
jgi:molybdenum cofactor cytidylyltransferase